MWELIKNKSDLSFFSKKLNFAKSRFFYINTDYKCQTFTLKNSSEWHSPWQAWHFAFLSEFTSDICCIEGELNQVADALSQNVYALSPSPVVLEALASAQSDNEELQQLASSTTSLKLEYMCILQQHNIV